MSKKKTTIEFIKQSIIIHGDKYDYSIVVYITSKIKVNIICKKHGVFEQTPDQHLHGYGCNKCKGGIKLSKNQIIKSFKKIHKNKYNYSLIDYKNSHTKVNIICKEHGIFKQTPNSHKSGNGCPKCVGKQKNNKSVIWDFQNVHENKYNYSLVKYINSQSKIKILCNIHGIFEQTPSKHIFGQGCPKCNESKGEKEIREILETNNINYIIQKTFNGCKYKRKLKFDFYLPKYNLCIEYDGEQHFVSKKHFGGEQGLKIRQKRDKIKHNYCKENNIKLLRIKYNENIKKILIKKLIIL